jgi:hypothetical protein
MTGKINLDSLSLATLDSDLRTVVKPESGYIVSKLTGIGNDVNLSRIRPCEYVQPSVSDLRMVVRVQRKNKHPHSTKKHK